MSNKYLFSLKIKPVGDYENVQEDLKLSSAFDIDEANKYVSEKLSESKLKVESPITYTIKDGFLLAEGIAHQISDFSFGFLEH